MNQQPNAFQGGQYFGWDARREWVFELIRIATKVSDADVNQPREWFESLNDYYDWSYPIIIIHSRKLTNKGKDVFNFEKALDEVEPLIYSRTTDPNTLNKAYKKMRLIFREMNLVLTESNIFIPLKDLRDPGKAIGNIRPF